MPAPTAPRCLDATVAFDDVLVERWHHAPCVLCQAQTGLSSWRARSRIGCTRRSPYGRYPDR
jgi:hypothetical protein